MFKRTYVIGYTLLGVFGAILCCCWYFSPQCFDNSGVTPSFRQKTKYHKQEGNDHDFHTNSTLKSTKSCSPSPVEQLSWPPILETHVVNDWQDTKQQKIMEPLRKDVLTITPWLAPIVWDGTFDTDIIDHAFKDQNFTIATTVFAVAKYTRYLQDFLETAEKYFMVGLAVKFYVFTDQPDAVPNITMAEGRQMNIIKVPKYSRWQEISMRRMEVIQKAIDERIRHEANYIYCVDVDMKFHSRVGAEILGRLVAVLNPWLHKSDRNNFSYERRTVSTAYIPYNKGDFYYAGGFFGGAVGEVYELVRACRANLEADKAVGVEAKWQEESHVNRYLLTNKPTKVLSPEYIWDEELGKGGPEIKVIRYATIRKNMKEVRENI